MVFEAPNRDYMVMGDDAIVCPKCFSTEIVVDEEKYEAYCNKCGYVITNTSIEFGRQKSRTRTIEF